MTTSPHPRRARRARASLVVVAASLALLLAACWAPALSSSATTYAVTVTSGVTYGRGTVAGGDASKALLLDLYLPQGTNQAKHPLVVVVHGGGFVGGSRSQDNVVTWARAFAARGYVVASIDYRLVGDDPVPSARMAPALALIDPDDPQQVTAVAAVDDTLTALDFLRARGDVDPAEVALIGGSAGAVTVDNVSFVLDDLGIARPAIGAVVSNWGGLPLAPAAVLVDGPAAGEPAVFLAHTTGDPTVPYQLSVDLHERAEAVGLTTDVHTKRSNSHGFATEREPYGDGRTLLEAQVDFVTCALYPDKATDPSCTWD